MTIYRTPKKMTDLNSKEILNDLLKIIGKNEPLTLDMSQTEYISSAALRALLITAKSASSKQLEQIRITNLKAETVLDIIMSTGFDNFFKIE